MRGYPARWIVYDTETRSRPVPGESGRREMRFRLGCAVFHGVHDRFPGDDDWLNFTDPGRFHDWIALLEKTDEPIYIFAHNHGFDGRVVGFFERLALGEYSLLPMVGVRRAGAYRTPLFVIDGRPFLLRLWRPDGQQLVLGDLGNWLDTSLAKIGAMMGSPKWAMPPEDSPDSVWLDYCRRDVEITVRALERVWGFCRSIGVKHWQMTLASQAYQSFARRYSRKTIKVPDDPDLMDLDRHAYYGGRQEAFQLGRIEGPIVQVDVNSMYPSAMKDGLFPVSIEEYELDAKVKTAGDPPHPAQSTAEVWIDSPEQAYPVRCRDGVWYCRGKVRTILCGPELRRACEQGHVCSYGRWVRYRMSRIFTSYVSDLWSVRMEARDRGDKIGDRLAKMMMDSLFGKFGQRSGEWITLRDDYPRDHYGQGIVVTGTGNQTVDWRTIAGVYQRRMRDQLAPHAFVPIAAFVTSYGRIFMDAVRTKLWERGIYYQATDCLLVDVPNYDMLMAAGLVKEDEIGMFRKEGEWEWVEIKGLNQIDRPGNPILSGIPGAATSLGNGVYQHERWDGTWTGILMGRVSSVSTKMTLTSLNGTYPRASVLASGRCQPWEICNWNLTPEQQARMPISLGGDRRT